MIIVRLIGGLGNQMFQYALGRHLALKNDANLKLDISDFKNYKLRNYELNPFNISADIISKLEMMCIEKFNNTFLSKLIGMDYTLVKQKTSGKQKNLYYDESILKRRGNIYLVGSWQCEEYFKAIRDILVKDFGIKHEPDKRNKSMLEKIENSNSVCIHVRRGDYISDKKTSKVHGTCSLEYYHNAVKIIEKKVRNPEFFVFSDDSQWIKANLKLRHPITYVNINNPEKGYEDLRLMSNCKHFIIANSSFSWWGAWLSNNPDKIICAPKKWFVSVDEGDIVPKSWIRVEG